MKGKVELFIWSSEFAARCNNFRRFTSVLSPQFPIAIICPGPQYQSLLQSNIQAVSVECCCT